MGGEVDLDELLTAREDAEEASPSRLSLMERLEDVFGRAESHLLVRWPAGEEPHEQWQVFVLAKVGAWALVHIPAVNATIHIDMPGGDDWVGSQKVELSGKKRGSRGVGPGAMVVVPWGQLDFTESDEAILKSPSLGVHPRERSHDDEF